MSRWSRTHSVSLVGSPLLGVNFHHVSRDGRADMTRVLTDAARFGSALELSDATLQPGRHETVGPRTFVAFYDGYRDTGLFGAELCHRLGIRAFFFPVFTCPDPGRGELTDEDLAQLATVHEIGFHTSSHLRADEVTPDNVDHEVIAPIERLQSITGRRARVGAWRGGNRFDPSTLGDETVRDQGVRFLVSNWSVEAIPPEPSVQP